MVMVIHGIEAVIFDMDGTLIDSEVNTERAVASLLQDRGIEHTKLDLTEFHGITWEQTAALLRRHFPTLADSAIPATLHDTYHRLLSEAFPPEIPGARAAVVRASASYATAITTSSNRESVALLVERLELDQHLRHIVCADDCTRSKPDPECYLLTAERLDCPPAACLVFEDSIAGLTAAKAAGMQTVGISHGKSGDARQTIRQLSDHCVDDYTELSADFFVAIGRSRIP